MEKEKYYNSKKYNKINKFRKNAILNFINIEKPVILDIGCSDGQMGEIIKKEKDAIVFGVDISESAISEAKSKIDDAYILNIEEEILKWPEEIKNQKYDYIIISEVLEHIVEPEKFLEKLKEVIQKNTEIIITVPNILFWKNRLRIFFGNFDYTEQGLMDEGHVHFFSWQSFKKTIWRAGYEIIAINNHIPTRGTKKIGKIFPGLFSYQFIVKIKKKEKVVYTAIFGGKDNLIEPKFVPKDFDFVCFTDSDFKSNVWQIRKMEPTHNDPVRSAKIFKILPHRYLPEYEYSIWIDGNILLRNDVNKLIMHKKDIAFYDHKNIKKDSRDCIYKEAEIIYQMNKMGKYKDDFRIIEKQINKYKKEGYPANNGLISGMIIFRRHNKPKVIKVMNDWWSEISENSRRDQISFNYVAWKNNFSINYIKGDSTNNKYFKRLLHKIKINRIVSRI